MAWDWALFGAAISGLLIGWFLGWRQSGITLKKNTSQSLSANYFKGINYLLSEKPDRAVDLFIKNIDITLDTIDTHLSLGALFRKLGENDRAIKIHQNLLAQTGLSRTQQENIQLELANDYLSSGLLDRAERILLELIDLGGRNRKKALQKIVRIYEQLKDWNLAQQYGEMLLKADGQAILTPLSHYCCESAEEFISAGDYTQALAKTKEALQYDRKCVRASILQAKIEAKTEQYKNATKAIHRINQQDEIWLGEIVDLVFEVYEKNDKKDAVLSYLNETLARTPQIKLALAVANHIQIKENQQKAETFLADYLSTNPSWIGLSALLDYTKHNPANNEEDIHQRTIKTLETLLDYWLTRRAYYICTNCGFKGQKNHWQCPSCKQWSSVRPSEDTLSLDVS